MLCNGCIIARCNDVYYRPLVVISPIIAHLSILLFPYYRPPVYCTGCWFPGNRPPVNIVVVAVVTDFVYILGQGQTHNNNV